MYVCMSSPIMRRCHLFFFQRGQRPLQEKGSPVPTNQRALPCPPRGGPLPPQSLRLQCQQQRLLTWQSQESAISHTARQEYVELRVSPPLMWCGCKICCSWQILKCTDDKTFLEIIYSLQFSFYLKHFLPVNHKKNMHSLIATLFEKQHCIQNFEKDHSGPQNVQALSRRPLYYFTALSMTDNPADWLFRCGRSRGLRRCFRAPPLGGTLSSTDWTWHFGSVHWAMRKSLDLGDSELICCSSHISLHPCHVRGENVVASYTPKRSGWNLEKGARMKDRMD